MTTSGTTVVDIEWTSWHKFRDPDKLVCFEGRTIIGSFRLTPTLGDPKYFVIHYPRKCQPDTVEPTSCSLEEAKERCQSLYRDKILSAIKVEPN